jgi:hypothetical protein
LIFENSVSKTLVCETVGNGIFEGVSKVESVAVLIERYANVKKGKASPDLKP